MPPLDVILSDRVLYRPLTGVGYYVRQLLSALRQEHERVAMHPLLGEMLPCLKRHSDAGGALPMPNGSGALGKRVKAGIRGLSSRPYAMLLAWRSRKYQVYHEPNHIPVPCKLPTVTTVHDLSVLAHPEWHPEDRVRWYERCFDEGCRQTSHFIAVSEFTRREMMTRLSIPGDRIHVTYQAARPEFTPQDEGESRRVCSELGLGERFFLFVGTLEPRKNVASLLQAHAALPPALRRKCPLVLAGGWGWNNEVLSAVLGPRESAGEVRRLGYVDPHALACLYSRCLAFVWPSLYEGFGLPPLEAMACGAPVIVSNAASLPEVVGHAGVCLDPRDVTAWTAAMRRIAEDSSWCDHWRQLGSRRSKEFSWARCARQTVEVYETCLAK